MLINIIEESLYDLKNLSEDNLLIPIGDIEEILKKNNLQYVVNQLPELLPKTTINEIDKIRLKHKEGLFKLKKKDIDLILNILKISEIYVKKTVYEEDIKFFYPVAIIFHHLQLKTKHLTLISDDKTFLKIIKLISKFLCNLKENYSLPEDLHHSIKVSHKEYIKGLEKDDLKLVYTDYVNKMKGYFPDNIFISFLARTLLLEPDEYVFFLKSIEKHFILIKYICMIENKLNNDIIRVMIRLEDKWMIIEYLRQIIKYNDKIYDENNILLVSTMFEKLYSIDEDFFIKGIILFLDYENQAILGKIIGNVIIKINNERIIENLLYHRELGVNIVRIYPNFNLGFDFETKLDKSLVKNINEYRGGKTKSNNIFWDNLLGSLIKFNEPLADFLAENVFVKWKNFLEDLWKSELIINDLVGTEFNYIVIYYFTIFLKRDESSFLSLLEQKLDEIINYKSYWIYHVSNKRFIPLTYVYAMSYAWKNVHNQKIRDKNINNKLHFLLNDETIFLSLFNQNDTPDRILEIESNFKI